MEKIINSFECDPTIEPESACADNSILEESALSSTGASLLLEEYRQRRKEIDDIIQLVHRDQQFGIIGVSAFWSWYISNFANLSMTAQLLCGFIPPLFCILFWARLSAFRVGMNRIASYILSIEQRFFPENVGWEMYCRSEREKYRSPKSLLARHFWQIFALLNLIALVSLNWAWFRELARIAD